MLRYFWRVVRARPGTTVLALAILTLAGAGAGLYACVLRQWEAAQVAVREGRPQEARRRLELCLLVWPHSAPVHLLAARAARLSGDLDGAEALLNRCLKLQHGATEAVQLEFLYLRVQSGEVDEVAAPLLDLVDQKHPEATLILETLARHYMHHLRYKEAYACVSGWIELEPDAAKPYHWRGWIHERLNNPKQAKDDYQLALARDPNYFAVRLRLAEIMLEDNHPLEAFPHLERLREEFPNRGDVRARLGQCRFLQGQAEEARRLMEAALKELPDDLSLLIQLAKLDLQEGRPAEAEARLRHATEVDLTDTEAQYLLANALQLQGRREEAAATLARSEENKALLEQVHQRLKDEAEHPSNSAEAAAEVGAGLLRLGRDRLGLYWLHEALKRDARNQPAHKALAEYYESKGEQDKAADHRLRLNGQDRVAPSP